MNCSIGIALHSSYFSSFGSFTNVANPHLGDGADPGRAFKVEEDPVQDRAFHVMRKKNLVIFCDNFSLQKTRKSVNYE